MEQWVLKKQFLKAGAIGTIQISKKQQDIQNTKITDLYKIP